MNYFFDTSAMVKLFHEEKGSDAVESIVAKHENQIWALELVRLELFSAIARRCRQREISRTDFFDLISDFEEQLETFIIEPMGHAVLVEAEKLMKKFGLKHGLRSLDALQLGAFRLLADTDWIFLCADRKLCDIAEECGIKVKNPMMEL